MKPTNVYMYLSDDILQPSIVLPGNLNQKSSAICLCAPGRDKFIVIGRFWAEARWPWLVECGETIDGNGYRPNQTVTVIEVCISSYALRDFRNSNDDVVHCPVLYPGPDRHTPVLPK